jgi:hypothetical protein
MKVFLVPVGSERYDLYCEATGDAEPPDDPAGGSSWWRRQVTRFRRTLAEAEAERHQRERAPGTERRGLWRTAVGKLAETVAEQRLLWRLRRQDAATLVHPLMPGPAALELARRQLTADRDKHRRWCAIDAGIAAVTAPIALLPGPNVFAYYFMFRALGHYYSLRGAARGLGGVEWTTEASPHLTALGAALSLDPGARQQRIEEISTALGLDRLAAFVNRVARPRA